MEKEERACKNHHRYLADKVHTCNAHVLASGFVHLQNSQEHILIRELCGVQICLIPTL